MVGVLIDAKVPAALVTVRRKVVLEERGPVETPEPLPTLPTPLLMTPVPLEKFGNNSADLPLVTVVTGAVRLVATGAGTAGMGKGAEIGVTPWVVSGEMKGVMCVTVGNKRDVA